MSDEQPPLSAVPDLPDGEEPVGPMPGTKLIPLVNQHGRVVNIGIEYADGIKDVFLPAMGLKVTLSAARVVLASTCNGHSCNPLCLRFSVGCELQQLLEAIDQAQMETGGVPIQKKGGE